MNMLVSSGISSTTNDLSIRQSTEYPLKKDTTTTSLPMPLNEWSILSDITQLKLNERVLHQGKPGVVTFIDTLYAVVTLDGMQYGVLVYPANVSRVRIKSLST